MDAREIWFGRSFGSAVARLALTPLSWLYAASWQSYSGMYRLGLKKAEEPHRPVVCIGNLMIGGTGKSPLTVYMAELLHRMGRKVVVSASGYGSPHAKAATVVPPGPINAHEWGDEPAMFRWLLPDVPLIVGRRRVVAAELCHERFPDHVMLMDDGFQHLPLKKHLSILLDPPNPANTRCLPAGPYREPRGNRNRASLVLPGEFRVVEEELTFDGANGLPPDFSVLCALGQPDRFMRSLPGVPRTSVLMSDHDSLSAGTLFDSLPKDLPVVITAKDWVKLRERPDVAERQLMVARQAVRIEPEEAFVHWLGTRLDEFKAEST